MVSIDMNPLELAALIASRVCHDVISPVGAIANGLEVLEEEKDESMREMAMDLVRQSALQASAKLQFARLAFGASGSAGASIDLDSARDVAQIFFSHEKADLEWAAPSALLPKNQVKLLLNLLLLAGASVPRGGSVRAEVAAGEGDTVIRLHASGPRARFPASAKATLLEGIAPNPLDAHAIQPLYARMLADDAGMALTLAEEEESVVLGARNG